MELFEKLRKRTGLSQRAFAKEAGVDRQRIAKYERPCLNITCFMQNLVAVKDRFHMDWADLGELIDAEFKVQK